MKNLQSMELLQFIRSFRAESAAFWVLCFYILIEYIRIQQMYPALDILPWGQLAILACVASIYISGSRAIGFGAMDKFFIAFSILVVISGIFAWNTGKSLSAWTTYTSWVLMYFCIVSILTTPNRLLLFILFFILINFKLSQFGARTFAIRGFTFTHWGLAGSPGWFHNSGELALEMVIMFAISWSILAAFREHIRGTLRWWALFLLFPGTAALTVIGSSSRGGQIALLSVLFVGFVKGRDRIKWIFVLAALVYAGWNFIPEEQLARFDMIGEDETSEYRLIHWKNAIKTIEENPLTGIGYNNWLSYYPIRFDPVKVEEIHNSVLEAFVELGYPGGILFLIMVFASFRMNAKSKREMNTIGGAEGKAMAAIAAGLNLSMLGTFIAACFMSVLFYPMFWMAFALTSALRHISVKMVATKNNSPDKLKPELESRAEILREKQGFYK